MDNKEQKIYELRIYDTPLVTFRMELNNYGEYSVFYLNSDDTKRHLFPIDLELSDEGLSDWIYNRALPKNRIHADEMLKSICLRRNDSCSIIKACLGLSLNDSYWIAPENSDAKFSGVNLYRNSLNKAVSYTAFTGKHPENAGFSIMSELKRHVTDETSLYEHDGPSFISPERDKSALITPELTTDGMLPKAWRNVRGDICLYKGGLRRTGNAYYEVYSEHYAYQVAQAMGLNAVSYDLVKWENIIAAKCRLFTDINTSFMPMRRIVKKRELHACIDYLSDVDKSLADDMRSMLVFDAVIYNEDRHFGNFGILRDNGSGRVLSFAPLFDQGFSLFCFGTDSDFKDLNSYAKTRVPSYRGRSFESICAEMKTDKQNSQLCKLSDFRFVRHAKYNLPEERLQAIEKHIQKRARELVKL